MTMENIAGYLEDAAGKNPKAAEAMGALRQLFDRKLWHQLTDKLEEIAREEIVVDVGLIELYDKVVKHLENKLNTLRVAQLAVMVSSRYPDREAAVDFLQATAKRLREGAGSGVLGGGLPHKATTLEGAAAQGGAEAKRRTEEPLLFLKMHIALLQLHGGDLATTKTLLVEGQATLDGLVDVDPSVHAALHHTACMLHKAKQEFAEFYRAGMLYLAYISVDSLDSVTRLALAVDLSLAALLGDDLYNFGELLAHPVLKFLEEEGCGYNWLVLLLKAFNAGDLERYDQLCVQYAEELNAQPALVANERKLREKITILCLMEIIFSLPADNRVISLELIAAKTKLSVDGVEFLLMKTLSVHLIEGVIDQVDGTVNISWVQPRVLGLEQIAELRGRLDTWLGKVKATLVTVESETPELVGMA